MRDIDLSECDNIYFLLIYLFILNFALSHNKVSETLNATTE